MSVSSLGDFFDFFHLTDVRDVKVPHLHRATWTSQRLSSHIQYIDVYGSHKYKYSMYTCALWSKDRRLIKVISLLRILIHGWMAIPFHGKVTPASTPNSFFSIFPHFCIKSLLFGFEFPPFLLPRLPSAITSTEQFLYVSRFISTLFISPKLYLAYISIKYIIYIYIYIYVCVCVSLCVNRIYLRQAYYLHQKKAYAISVKLTFLN